MVVLLGGHQHAAVFHVVVLALDAPLQNLLPAVAEQVFKQVDHAFGVLAVDGDAKAAVLVGNGAVEVLHESLQSADDSRLAIAHIAADVKAAV